MADLSGQINLKTIDDGTTTSLDEPISETLKREFQRVLSKLKCVLNPRLSVEERSKEVRDWDLWGPLFICLFLATILSLSSSNNKNEASAVFAIIFLVVWAGASIVSINAQLLGGSVSFFQSVCVLGYSIFPLTIAALLIVSSFLPSLLQIALVALGATWSVYSSIGFLTQLVPPRRKLLADYPLVLFFSFLAWFILVVQ